MKILYVITQADGGGAQTYVLSLAKRFQGSIAAGNEADELFRAAANLPLTTYHLQHLKRNIHPWHDLLAMIELRKLIKSMRPKIVHLNSTKAGFLGSLAAAGTGTKVVFTAHGFRFLEPLSPLSRWFYLQIEKWASRHRDYIITVSEADRLAALRNRIISNDKISTIHNGLPPLTFLARDEARAQLHLPQHTFVFGTIANFYKTKGLDVLIKAASKLDSKIIDKCQFIIIGDGPESGSLKLEVRRLNLQKSILIPGNIPRAYTYMKAFDVFLLPSRKEGFPMVLLEAMQAGIPILSTKVGGIPESVGNAGYMVQPGDFNELARAITKFAGDKELTGRLAAAAKDRATMFSEDKMLAQTEKIYKQTLFLNLGG